MITMQRQPSVLSFFASALCCTLIFALTSADQALAQGGPPMITDDPHTIGPGRWEINVAQLSLFSGNSTVTQSPYLDLNWGVGENLQVKYETGVSSMSPSNLPYGGPFATTGVRWRFLSQKDQDLEISTYPQYSFYPSYYGSTTAANTSSSVFFLPVEVSKKWGRYTFNPEMGYGFARGDDNFWSLGLLLGREMNPAWSLMVELHTQSPLSFNQSQNILNVGTAVDLGESFTLLASMGTSLGIQPGYGISYLGLQIHL